MGNYQPFNSNNFTAQVAESALHSVQLLLESVNNVQLNTELLTELSDRLSAVENILRNFILRLNIPTLSSAHGHEVHQFLCLALGNHRDACLLT
jgi:histidinol-phosphate/aromatic aminotransferase/cobyric acid decarboxylase-like protein